MTYTHTDERPTEAELADLAETVKRSGVVQHVRDGRWEPCTSPPGWCECLIHRET